MSRKHTQKRKGPSPEAKDSSWRKLPAEILEEEANQLCPGSASPPVLDLGSALSVGLGGSLGSLLRYLLAGWMDWRWGALPVGFLLVNVTGSFAIGFIDELSGPRGAWPMGAQGRRFFMVGVCGGYTTFSSFALLTLVLAREQSWVPAALNVFLSFTLCLAATGAGQVAAAFLDRDRP